MDVEGWTSAGYGSTMWPIAHDHEIAHRDGAVVL
jgi:hypothetical protein